MRAIAVTVTLAGSLGWVGCLTPVNMGGTKDAGDVVNTGGCAPGSCGPGFYCSPPNCKPLVSEGAGCVSNDNCVSGICGVAGSGNCCTSACSTSDLHGCGATDCDTSGACIYPATGTSCLALACAGHTLTEPASCDGHGSCAIPSPATIDCAPYQCAPTASCGTNCSSNADCSVGFCHVASAVCCPPYAGNQIEVDGTQGQNTGCCGGSTGSSACATIAYAVGLAGEIASSGITIHVANPPSNSFWFTDPLPIQLSYGLTLSAPGIYFSAASLDGGPPDFNTPIFLIHAFGGEEATWATIAGSATDPVVIGIDSYGFVPLLATMIVVAGPETLFLRDANVHDSIDANIGFGLSGPFPNGPTELNSAAGIQVLPGATLTLGADKAGGSGTVSIGGAIPVYAPHKESVGIICYGSDAGYPAFVNDVGATTTPSVTFQNQQVGLAALSGCNVQLDNAPRFGAELASPGVCPTAATTAVTAGLYLGDGQEGDYEIPTASVSSASFECLGKGVWINGPATFLGDTDSIQFNSVGIEGTDLNAGLSSMSQMGHSIVAHNALGLRLVAAQAFDLTQQNQVSCNDPSQSGGMPSPFASTPGMGMLLEDSSIQANRVAWNHWDPDAGHTQTWTCTDETFTACTCAGDSSCPAGSGPLGTGADVVVVGATLLIDDSLGSLAPDGCP